VSQLRALKIARDGGNGNDFFCCRSKKGNKIINARKLITDYIVISMILIVFILLVIVINYMPIYILSYILPG
jgi:hypothetical protein